MNEEESVKIWNLRNLDKVSSWMVNPDSIPWNDHCGFIESLKINDHKDYFIIENFDSEIIGSVNIDYSENGISERGIFINPDFFHQNHAYRSMIEFYEYAKDNFDIVRIITKVKIDNIASNKLESKLSAKLIETKEGYNIYSLQL